MKKMFLVTVLAATALGAQAQAYYVGVGAGYINVNVGKDLNKANSILADEFGGTVTTSADGSIYSLRNLVGYNYNENFAVEVGYINTKKYDARFAGVDGDGIKDNFTVAGKYSGFDLSAVVRPSKSSGYNNFFGTIGVHSYTSKVSVSITDDEDTFSETARESGEGILIGVGYDYNIQKDVDIRFGMTRLNNLAGESSSDYTNYSVGIIKRF